jgi:Xaa-Pro aminopeptidase
LRVARLRLEIRRVLAEHGLEQPEGNLVACGGDAGVPHSQGANDRQIRAGEPILVDLFPKGSLFADCTRVFCLGKPPEPLERAHQAVLDTLRWATRAAVPGIRGWTLQEGACGLLHAAGYPTPLTDPGTTTGYVHGLGHGVGYELHEDPSFRKEAGREGVLAEGDVFTLEPGLYDPVPDGGYGVRLEDLVVLGPAGLENLTPLPYVLDPRAWE